MFGFSNLHILTVHRGEVYLHHVWLLFFAACFVFSQASSTLRIRSQPPKKKEDL